MVASCYSSVLQHHLAHQALAPLRWWYRFAKLFAVEQPFDYTPDGGIHWLPQAMLQLTEKYLPSVLTTHSLWSHLVFSSIICLCFYSYRISQINRGLLCEMKTSGFIRSEKQREELRRSAQLFKQLPSPSWSSTDCWVGWRERGFFSRRRHWLFSRTRHRQFPSEHRPRCPRAARNSACLWPGIIWWLLKHLSCSSGKTAKRREQLVRDRLEHCCPLSANDGNTGRRWADRQRDQGRGTLRWWRHRKIFLVEVPEWSDWQHRRLVQPMDASVSTSLRRPWRRTDHHHQCRSIRLMETNVATGHNRPCVHRVPCRLTAPSRRFYSDWRETIERRWPMGAANYWLCSWHVDTCAWSWRRSLIWYYGTRIDAERECPNHRIVCKREDSHRYSRLNGWMGPDSMPRCGREKRLHKYSLCSPWAAQLDEWNTDWLSRKKSNCREREKKENDNRRKCLLPNTFRRTRDVASLCSHSWITKFWHWQQFRTLFGCTRVVATIFDSWNKSIIEWFLCARVAKGKKKSIPWESLLVRNREREKKKNKFDSTNKGRIHTKSCVNVVQFELLREWQQSRQGERYLVHLILVSSHLNPS